MLLACPVPVQVAAGPSVGFHANGRRQRELSAGQWLRGRSRRHRSVMQVCRPVRMSAKLPDIPSLWRSVYADPSPACAHFLVASRRAIECLPMLTDHRAIHGGGRPVDSNVMRGADAHRAAQGRARPRWRRRVRPGGHAGLDRGGDAGLDRDSDAGLDREATPVRPRWDAGIDRGGDAGLDRDSDAGSTGGDRRPSPPPPPQPADGAATRRCCRWPVGALVRALYPLGLTFFRDCHDRYGRARAVSWSRLAARCSRHNEREKDGPALACCTFQPGQPRGKRSVCDAHADCVGYRNQQKTGEVPPAFASTRENVRSAACWP